MRHRRSVTIGKIIMVEGKKRQQRKKEIERKRERRKREKEKEEIWMQ